VPVLVVEKLVEDFSERAAPARARRHWPFEIGRVSDPLLERPGQVRGSPAQLFDEVALRLVPPAPDLAGIPPVLIEWFTWADLGLREGGLNKARSRLLRAAEMRQQIVCGPIFVTRRLPPGVGTYPLQSLDG
jgi:hypothetical protein